MNKDNNQAIYFDNSATTKIDSEVISSMKNFLEEEYGNASSFHELGFRAKKALNESRELIAKSLGVKSSEVFFTSGGTESNNWALKGVAFANKDKGKHILLSSVEHSCSKECAKWLALQGFEIEYIPVNKFGEVQEEELKKRIREDTILVSIIHGNNEIGTINDISKLSLICKDKNVLFHSDACQSYTKVPINLSEMNVDLLTINSHKIHGPKGVGALIIKEKTKIQPISHGGGQENGFRGGTENISGIVGFAKASTIHSQEDINRMIFLRDYIIKEIIENISGVNLNGAIGDKRLCNNIHLSFKRIEGEAISGLLDEKNIMTSTGSACSSNSLDPSHVLSAIQLSHEDMNGSLRISISKYTSQDEVDAFIIHLISAVNKLRKISAI